MGSIIVLVLDKLGKGVVLREIIALHTTFVCLVMPVVGYTFFDRTNKLARSFLKYMRVTDHVYFGYALPAIAGFVVVLCWPLTSKKYSDEGVFLRKAVDRAKTVLEGRPKLGIYLLLSGTVMFWLAWVLPEAIQFFFLLFFFAGFAGFLYVFYQPNLRFRRLFLWGFGSFIILTALSSGMFTVVAYMSLTLFSFFFLGKRSSLFKKMMLFLLGVFVLLLIQSIKPAYRVATWQDSYEGNKAMLFASLMIRKLNDPNWASTDAFFPIYTRTNQGFNVSLVMRRFPETVPYDGGHNLLINLASSLVPRVFWPNKPEAGGKANMKYYAGLTISGFSTNVGPLGEAYGSFGPFGGICFMIFVGLFIRWAYTLLFKWSANIPLLIFWLPVMFYQTTYAGETDTLQIFNSVLKSSFFIFLLYRQWPQWFGGQKKRPGPANAWRPEENLNGIVNPIAD